MKYIVYLTVNIINHKVYVGVHKTNPDIFDGYIGCGVNHKDSKKSRLKGFPAAVRKYGYKNFIRHTLKIFPYTEQGFLDAYKLEEIIVNEKFVKSKNTYNLTKGGRFTVHENLKKEVAQYTIDGHFIRTWSSITEAEETLGLTAISQAVHGISKYCGDFQWRLYTNEDDIDPVEKKEKTVYQYDLQGNLIKVWKSVTEASKKFENTHSARVAICNVCTSITHQAYGYYWSYKNKFEYKPSGTAVAKYNDSGKFLESYSSIKEAAQKNNVSSGNICSTIKGKQKRCGGFRWRYFYGNTADIASL